MATREVGTEYDPPPLQEAENSDSDSEETDRDDRDHECFDDEINDPNYQPDVEDFVEECHKIHNMEEQPPHKEKKYLVFQSNLLQLFQDCREIDCFCIYKHKQLRLVGTMVVIDVKCVNGHEYTWYSQPCHNALPWGNLCAGASLLFSGSSFRKVSNLFNHMNVPFICPSTYYQMQRAYLIPVVVDYWKHAQDVRFTELQGKQLNLGGDGRCDSPGYCAKYGTYTLMDLERNKVLDTQVVQVNIFNANLME